MAAFLAGSLPFIAIPRAIEEVLANTSIDEVNSVDDVLAADTVARTVTAEWIARFNASRKAAD